MPAIPNLKYSALEPAALDAAADAYEQARDDLRLSDHIDPLTSTLAEKVIAAAQTGERDPKRLARMAIEALGASLREGMAA